MFQISMASSKPEKKITTCMLCGGSFVNPETRLKNHLLHEHGVIFNLEYIFIVSQYKDSHSTLPPVAIDTPKDIRDKKLQTELLNPDLYLSSLRPCSKNRISTPCRNDSEASKGTIPPTISPLLKPRTVYVKPSTDSAPKSKKLKVDDTRSKENVVVEGRHANYINSERSGFQLNCALCSFVTNNGSSFRNHITKKHKLNISLYKQEYGSCQTPIGSGMFQCFVCNASVKHLPGAVDKHLRIKHSMTWVEYLKCLRDNCMKLVETDAEKSKPLNIENDKSMLEGELSRRIDEVKCPKKKPLNIKDKKNKYCNQCDITFGSRILFLKHCQSIHKLRFKNKSGDPLILDKAKKMYEEIVQNEVEVKPNTSLTSIETREVAHKSEGFGRNITTDKFSSGAGENKTEEVSFDNQIEVDGMSSVYINTFLTPGQETSNPPSSNDDGSPIESHQGFKCYKCGRSYKKMGNLTKHLATC